MPPSSASTDVLHILHGDDDWDVIHNAIADRRIASVIATCNSVHPTVRTIAALASSLPSSLANGDLSSPAVSAVLSQLVADNKGSDAIWTWAHHAPAASAHDLADTIMAAVRSRQCPSVAIALIPPSDESAACIDTADIAMRVICRWGKSRPDTPTWWTRRLSDTALNRLTNLIRTSSLISAKCLPWLPTHAAHAMMPAITQGMSCIDAAREAFAEASPAARDVHADIVATLVSEAQSRNPAPLARLATAMNRDDAWRRVRDMLVNAPDTASSIVASMPWDAIEYDTQECIINLAPSSGTCAAIAAARGRWRGRVLKTERAVSSFFAAIDPALWDTLPAEEQRQWLVRLTPNDLHLAVRSLGVQTSILVKANRLGDHLVAAARPHVSNESDLRDALFPVALKDVALTDIYPLIAAMPSIPGDPVTAFTIACGGVSPSVDHATAQQRLAQPRDLAAAIVMQRSAAMTSSPPPIHERTAALANALQHRTHNDVNALLDLLDENVRIRLRPPSDIPIAERQAARNHVQDLRHAVTLITSLAPDVAIPAYHAFVAFDDAWEDTNKIAAASALVQTLQRHGDLVLALLDALDTEQRTMVIPTLDSSQPADALRNLIADNPYVAHRLAHAVRSQQWNKISSLLLTMPHADACAVWNAIPQSARTDMLAWVTDCIRSHVDERQHNEMPLKLARIAAWYPLTMLAIVDILENRTDMSIQRIAVRAIDPDALRTILPLLDTSAQSALLKHPDVHVAVADILNPDEEKDTRRRHFGRRRY